MNLDNLKKQAKSLVRWHREGDHSVGGRIRQLPRYRGLTDVQILSLKFPLREAQEVVALEAGLAGWAELKARLGAAPKLEAAPKGNQPAPAAALPTQAMPVVFVSNVQASAEFYRDRLGFAIDFLHGRPAFYGSVSRDGASIRS